MVSEFATDSVVSLPMYDWPELTDTTDRLWSRMYQRLRAVAPGLAPTLERDAPDHGWSDARLALSQTCGFPLVTRLASRVELLTTPVYRVEHCRAGYYRSPVLVRKCDTRKSLQDFRGARLAVNSLESQSGFNALRNLLLHRRLLVPSEGFFSGQILSGSHRESLRLLAEGAADLCALDPVSWALARRYAHGATELRVLDLSDWSPALPLIASRQWLDTHVNTATWRDLIGRSLGAAIDEKIARELYLRGSTPIHWCAYRTVARVDCDLLIP